MSANTTTELNLRNSHTKAEITTLGYQNASQVATHANLVVANFALGVGQTWYDYSTSGRVASTIYENTTGRPMQVCVTGAGSSGLFQVSLTHTNWITTGGTGDANVFRQGSATIVPHLYHYLNNECSWSLKEYSRSGFL